MSTLLEAGEIKRLDKRKRWTLILFATCAILAVLGCALRFVPRWNDRLSGRPEYAKAMATLTAQEIARVMQNGVPAIVLGEDDRCHALQPTGITADEIAASLYVLTWSEKQRFTCMTTYAVPVDASKFANLITLYPGEGWTAGPALARPIQVVPVNRFMHVFPQQYLQLLHWRAKPRLPIPESDAASLVGRSYASTSDPSIRPDTSAGVELDFNQARALVRGPHDRMNHRLSLLLVVLSLASLGSALALFVLYRKTVHYEWLCASASSGGMAQAFLPVHALGRLPIQSFLFHDLYLEETAARNQHWAQQQALVRQKQQGESLHLQRQELEFRLRSALETLHDVDLKQKVEGCLAVQPRDVDQAQLVDRLARLWEEVIKDSAQKTPEERLAMLLESLKPYCTEAELAGCCREALSILEKSGFRSARQYVVGRHDGFRQRARAAEREAAESQEHPLVE